MKTISIQLSLSITLIILVVVVAMTMQDSEGTGSSQGYSAMDVSIYSEDVTSIFEPLAVLYMVEPLPSAQDKGEGIHDNWRFSYYVRKNQTIHDNESWHPDYVSYYIDIVSNQTHSIHYYTQYTTDSYYPINNWSIDSDIAFTYSCPHVINNPKIIQEEDMYYYAKLSTNITDSLVWTYSFYIHTDSTTSGHAVLGNIFIDGRNGIIISNDPFRNDEYYLGGE